ncbi:MAG: Fic family protein [Mariprofundaceae bacterium]
MNKQQATALFAQEKNKGSLQGILGNVYQSEFGADVYPTLEEKAANLLYFIIKNQPFNDGNKRSGAFAFIWFLQQAGIDFQGKITPKALTSLPLLIAENQPESKDRMIGLVILLLTGKGVE